MGSITAAFYVFGYLLGCLASFWILFYGVEIAWKWLTGDWHDTLFEKNPYDYERYKTSKEDNTISGKLPPPPASRSKKLIRISESELDISVESIMEDFATVVLKKGTKSAKITRKKEELNQRHFRMTGLRSSMVHGDNEEKDFREMIIEVQVGGSWRLVFLVIKPTYRSKYRVIKNIKGGWADELNKMSSEINYPKTHSATGRSTPIVDTVYGGHDNEDADDNLNDHPRDDDIDYDTSDFYYDGNGRKHIISGPGTMMAHAAMLRKDL